jgi:hypothetical protein
MSHRVSMTGRQRVSLHSGKLHTLVHGEHEFSPSIPCVVCGIVDPSKCGLFMWIIWIIWIIQYVVCTLCELYMWIIYVDYICRWYLVYIICRLYTMISGVICGLYMGTYVRCIYEYVSFITLPHKLTKGLKTWGYNDSPKNGGSLTLKVYINPSVFLPMPLSIYPTIDLSICLSSLSTYLSSISLSVPLSIHLSNNRSIHLFI